MFPRLLARSESEERVCGGPERLDALLSKSLTRLPGQGPPKRERLVEERSPFRRNFEAIRLPVRPCGLLHPTPFPQQRQSATDGGFVHFEVFRHISGAEALHRCDQRQNGQVIGPNPAGSQGVVEDA